MLLIWKMASQLVCWSTDVIEDEHQGASSEGASHKPFYLTSSEWIDINNLEFGDQVVVDPTCSCSVKKMFFKFILPNQCICTWCMNQFND